MDTVASAIFNFFDTYGSPIFITLSALLILGAILLLSYWMETELIDLDGLGGIFRWVRDSWRRRTNA